MYTILHETDDSTTVNFSERGNFLAERGTQLVTVGSKFLRILRINPYALVPEGGQHWKQTARLECVISARLLASPRSLAVARIPQNPSYDSILLAFDDAKLSFISVNHAERSFKTLSLHAFEDEMLKDGFVSDLPSPIIRVDPGQRCCAMLIYGRHVAIIPFDESYAHLHSYTLALSSIDSRLINVVDMVFLDGYYEPTLLFLYEPVQSTPGRACIRYDTMCLLGVSLNVQEQVHASVWQLSNIPMDCFQMLPIPSPVGGVFLLAANSLIYLSQSVPPCGVAVNSCMDGYTKFPVKDLKEVSMTFDASVACCIATNKLLLCSRTGKMFVVTLVLDEGNAVKSFDLTYRFETSIPYTLTPLAPGYLFLGSRLGDSMLIEYAIHIDRIIKSSSDHVESVEKKVKLESDKNENTKPNGSNEEMMDKDDDDIALYGKILPLSPRLEENMIENIHFRVLDRLSNLAPCKRMCGCHPQELSSYFYEPSRKDAIFDLICACGHEKDGSICIFKRTIMPDIVTSSSIEGVVQYWAVGRREDDTNKYIIASKETSSLVLETEKDLVELESPIFITAEPTVAAGELADGALSIQVTNSSVVVVCENQQLQNIPLQLTFPVVSASIVDPFVAICTQNGRLLLFELVQHPHVQLQAIHVPDKMEHSHSPITAVSLYRDMSGSIRICSATRMNPSVSLQAKRDIDIEDMDDFLLYGDSQKKLKDSTIRRRIIGHRDVVVSEVPKLETDLIDPNTIIPSHWIVIARENGNAFIYSVPELKLVYMMKKVNNVPDIITDYVLSDDEGDPIRGNESAGLAAGSTKPEETIMEILLCGMGMNQVRPTLFILVDDTVAIYELFTFDNGIEDHLAIKFKRLPYTVVTRFNHFNTVDGKISLESGKDLVRHKTVLNFFERVGNILNGVFICSSYSALFFIDSGVPRLHPLIIDGQLLSFTSFNNRLCPNGFIYLTEKNRIMRIAKLPKNLEFDASYPFRKIHVGHTVHHVVYIMQSNVFAVSTSSLKSINKYCILVNEDKSFEEVEKNDSFVLPNIESFKVMLYSPEDWKPIPNTEIEFDDFEIITSFDEVVLKSESTVSGVQNYLAIGTSCNFGEEVLVRGRIVLAEIIEVVPEPGQPTSKHRIKQLYNKEQKGPVTSLCSCNGYLLTGMGQKVFIWAFRDNNLQGISFLDLHFYIHHLVSIRNLALSCDLYRSLSLLRYQEDFKALSLASRDMRTNRPSPLVSQFLVDNKQLAFVLSDEAGNISVFNYLPETLESYGGERLVLRSEINIGTNVNCLLRVQGHVSDGFIENEIFSSNRQNIIFSSLDGSFGYIRPLTEKVFRRLHMLQQLISSTVPQVAGLNAKGSRAGRPHCNYQQLNTRNTVDGDVVFQFVHLSQMEKNDLARKLGSTRHHIIDDLIEIKRSATIY